jgi:hypothetical protein
VLRAGRGAQGNWKWIPHDVEGYVVGQTVREYHDGTIFVKTMAGEVRHIARVLCGGACAVCACAERRARRMQEYETKVPDIDALTRVNLVELKKLTDDLVKLETVNDPFINHNLRERCKIDNIYVRFPHYDTNQPTLSPTHTHTHTTQRSYSPARVPCVS